MSLYKISAFSRLGQVTIKALRLYDHKGLLKPAQVDAETGYRYYSAQQLPRMHRLLALKAMGFSLEQIGQLLSDDLSLSQMQAMLSLKQAELQQQLIETQLQIAAVDTHLKYLQEERTMPTYEVILKAVEPINHALSVRDVIPTYTAVGQLFGELRAYLMQNYPAQCQNAGYSVTLWHDPDYKDKDVDAEAVVVVPIEVKGSDRIKTKRLEALETVASVVHRGSYLTLNQAYAAIMQWIEDGHYQITGPNREIYLQGGADLDNADYITEIQFPVKKQGKKQRKNKIK